MEGPHSLDSTRNTCSVSCSPAYPTRNVSSLIRASRPLYAGPASCSGARLYCLSGATSVRNAVFIQEILLAATALTSDSVDDESVMTSSLYVAFPTQSPAIPKTADRPELRSGKAASIARRLSPFLMAFRATFSYASPAEEDKDLFCCFGCFPSFTLLFPTTASKKRPDRLNRLSWQCAGNTEPGVVNTQHDCSIDPDTQGLSSTPSPLATEAAQIWDIYERRVLHHERILVEDTLSSIRELAGQAPETPRTATSNDDSQLASSVDQLSTVSLLGKFIESKCELGQIFSFTPLQ
jgi:hypothetical protein